MNSQKFFNIHMCTVAYVYPPLYLSTYLSILSIYIFLTHILYTCGNNIFKCVNWLH